MSTANQTFVRFATYARSAVDGKSRVGEQVSRCISQMAAMHPAWLAAKNCIFVDAGYSGSHCTHRPGLNKLLDVAQKQPPPFDYVVMTSTDRLARDLRETPKIVEFLRVLGISIYTLDQQLISAEAAINSAMAGITPGQLGRVVLKPKENANE